MLCGHGYVQKEVQAREQRIREALRNAGLTFLDHQVEFRDAGQIATWVNHHPAVAAWLKEQTQPGTLGPFHSWSHWAGRYEHEDSPWVEDQRLPPLQRQLFELVSNPHGVARVVGLSGVGKSRLVLEALASSDLGSSFPTDLVLFSDASEAEITDINRTVQTWAELQSRAVLVVDRCSPESHETLAKMVLRPSSRLSLITIDNEIPSGTLDGTAIVVDKAPHAVIEAVINGVSPGLPPEDQRRLVRFSEGFPGMAIRLAKSWNEARPVAHATEDHVVEDYIRGRSRHESDLLVKAAMLLATFGLVQMGHGASAQLQEIAGKGRGITADDLRASLERLRSRDVVQNRGRFVTLQPRPIAMRLAERQWQEWSESEWDSVLAGDTASSLRTLAARQLAVLNTTATSQRVVAHVCRPDGPFDCLDGATGRTKAEVLSALAEVDPQVVVNQIERALNNVHDLLEVKGDTRRHLVWALEKIAFQSETFDEGARLLLRLAIAENEDGISNNATGQFTALFPILAGSTAADGRSRQLFLKQAADTNDPIQRSVVVDALLSGAKTDFFSRLVGPESHGSKPALKEWRPDTAEGASDYISSCVAMLATIAANDDDSALAAREGLAGHLRSLVCHGFIDAVEDATAQVSQVRNEWPDAMESLGHYLEYDASDSDTRLICRVRRLIAMLQPTDLTSRVRFLVTEMPWDYPCGEKLDFDERENRQVEAVRALAVELASQASSLEGVLPQVSRGQQRMATVFGNAIAENTSFPSDSLERIVQAAIGAPKNERNFDLLSGFVSRLSESHPGIVASFKHRAAKSQDLAPALPLICWRLGVTSEDIPLVLGALEAGYLSPWQLEQWTLGGVLGQLPPTVVATLLGAMLEQSDEAFTVGIDLMGMYAHGAHRRLEDLKPQILQIAQNVRRWKLGHGDTMGIHHFETIMKWILNRGRRDHDACAVAFALSRAIVDSTDWDDRKFIRPVISLLLSRFPEISWPLIGQAIVSDQSGAWRFEFVLGEQFGPEKRPPILSLPEDTLFAWCHAYTDAAPAFAAAVVPVLSSHKVELSDAEFHPLMTRLLNEFGDRVDVRRAISRNLGTFGWSGSVSTYFALHQAPLRNLKKHPKYEVRHWAKVTLRELDERIESARIEEEEDEAHWSI